MSTFEWSPLSSALQTTGLLSEVRILSDRLVLDSFEHAGNCRIEIIRHFFKCSIHFFLQTPEQILRFNVPLTDLDSQALGGAAANPDNRSGSMDSPFLYGVSPEFLRPEASSVRYYVKRKEQGGRLVVKKHTLMNL